MRTFYLVQIGVSFVSPVFLPYGTGCIAAYLKQDKEITENFNIPDIVVMREKPQDIIKRFVNPDYVAFSCYSWNIEYNKVVAKMLKEKFPDLKIIFAGHQISPDGETLKELDYVDYLMHNEGEETTKLFLKALIHASPLSSVPNLSYRSGEKIITTEKYIPEDISKYPSPYLSGVFDNLMKEFPDREFHATLETNRGCPYSCAYCEWCFTKKVRPFPMEKIKKEIEWIASHKLKYCYCADANFGILDRDVDIARYVVEQKKKYGYPDVFKPCYAKESDDNVFKAGYILNSNSTDKGVTIAYQTLCPEALENIGRRNLTLEHFSSLDLRYTQAGIPTYTELILGLPGETYESFCKGMCSLLESGQNNSMTVYECQIYPNSPMAAPEYRKKHGIKTAMIPMLGIHYNPVFNGVEENLEIITETATLPKNDWVKANLFSVVLQTFHHLALLRFFAIYLHREKAVSYYDFYTSLYDFIYDESEGFLHDLFAELFERKSDTDTADWTYQKDYFGTTGYYFEEGAFLELIRSGDVFWKEIEPFLKKFNIETEVFEQLLLYQKGVLRTLDKNEVSLDLKYNFYNYFEDQSGKTELKCVNSRLSCKSELDIKNWAEYARKVVWFGKRYSAMLLTNSREKIEYTED